MNVIWSTDAKKKYYKTVEYLADNFSYNTALALENEVNKCVEYLKTGFQIGSYSPKSKSYKCVIKRYNLLIYKVRGENIYIANFIATRTNHKFNEA